MIILYFLYNFSDNTFNGEIEELKKQVLQLNASHTKSLEWMNAAQERMEIALKGINDFLESIKGTNFSNNIFAQMQPAFVFDPYSYLISLSSLTQFPDTSVIEHKNDDNSSSTTQDVFGELIKNHVLLCIHPSVQ